MGDAAAKASARALVSTQMANMAAQQRANIIAQYGPVSKMAIFTCKHIGRAFSAPWAEQLKEAHHPCSQ